MSAAQPESAGGGLRGAVLCGAFFGPAHRHAAERLAAFLAAPAEAAWFGADPALLADPARLRGAIDRDIAAIDEMIGRQLDAILHHPRLIRLEGSWRGLAWLAGHTDPGQRIRLRVLQAGWGEVCRDLERAPEFDQSNLFRRIYEDEFGSPGGEPFGLLVMDYELRHRPAPRGTDDVAALAALAAIAAAAFSPMVFGASAALFGVDALSELSGVADPAAVFPSPEYQRWRALSAREDMRFLAVALPRLRARLPWDEDLPAQRGFLYAEQVADAGEMIWFSAGYAVAFTVGRAMQSYGWPADMRGYETDRMGGGLIADVPGPRFSADPAGGAQHFATELALTDRQERALLEAGLMPLTAIGFGGETLLGGARSLQTSRRYAGRNAEAATANARISAQFNTIICVARFAHFVKVMGRDMTGAFRTASEIQSRLSAWLRRYVNGNTEAGPETRARYPLLAAEVQVTEQAGKPGVFGCVIQLQPQYQLDDIAATFRLVTELAAPA